MILQPGICVLAVGNSLDVAELEDLLGEPLYRRVGQTVEPVHEHPEWGPVWAVRFGKHLLEVAAFDLSAIPSFALVAGQRGFARGDFSDLHGSQCSLQESSRGSEGAIWLGVNDGGHADLREPDWGDGCPATGGRMHLSRGMVLALLPHLVRFVETGLLENSCPE